MKSTEYIEWDKLEQIPFCLCRIAEDEENQEIDVLSSTYKCNFLGADNKQ